MVWYKNSMHPLWMLVQTARGPTPLNQPPMPSDRYINLSPVVTEEVSRATAPGLGVCVDGEDVDINRFWSFCVALSAAGLTCPSFAGTFVAESVAATMAGKVI